ncbi:hypothetical protein A4X09_0g2774 [Tilletia walkeri]|uniref:histone acetyltransferase n=1 Tax=Tilletia walkeri TaxID=117179 RepID=A0A8X7T6Q5_9BASI|nr:hypothetical protein A4X09_0g2774 [Tilletia walkeri]
MSVQQPAPALGQASGSGTAPGPATAQPASATASTSTSTMPGPGPAQATASAEVAVASAAPAAPAAPTLAPIATAPTPKSASVASAGKSRSIDRVYFGAYMIKTWYFSPYPLPHINYSELNPGPTSLTKKTRRTTARSVAPAQTPITERLFVCEGCFLYQCTYEDYWVHKRNCIRRSPPGRKVYQRGAHTIWEVDGAKEFDYCLNLCLFGKLFIDHKTLYFDVDPFYFYVVTNGEGATHFDKPYGYFSKEKVSYEDYNLACIVTFPPYQRHGWGAMMIEFSYYLSALSGGNIGTPERPLSDLGLKGFLSYWTSVLLRTLALAFMSSHDTKEPPVLLLATTSLTLEPHEVRMNATLRIRRLLLGFPAARVNERPSLSNLGFFDDQGRPKPREEWTEQEWEQFKKVKRAPVGWAGEIMVRRQAKRRKEDLPTAGEQQSADTEPQQDEADTSYEHPLLNPAARLISIQTTLERLSIACNLRTEDLSFAMAEIGLLNWRVADQDSEPIVIPIGDGAAEKENTRAGGLAAAAEQATGNPASKKSNKGSEVGVVLITKEAVWEKIGERKLKKPVLDEAYILY